MRHILTAAALAVAATAAAATPVNAQSFSASRMVTEFDPANLTAVVEQMGGTVEARSDGDGYLVRFSNGTAATAKFTACANGPCLGISVSGRFGKPSDKTDAQVAALVVEFNRRWNAGKSYLTDDGRAVVQAYMIADGGITMENYRMQLVVYSQMLQKMRETIYTDG